MFVEKNLRCKGWARPFHSVSPDGLILALQRFVFQMVFVRLYVQYTMAASLWRTVLHICRNRGSKIVASLKQVHYQFGCFQLDDRVLRRVGEKFAREVDTVVPVAVLPVRDWMDSDDTLVAAGHTRQEDPCDVGTRGNELWPAPHLDNMRAVRFATRPVTEAFLHANHTIHFIFGRVACIVMEPGS